MGKRKCKFTAELQGKYKCFKKGRSDEEAECLVCKAGTYVSVASRGALDLETHISTEKHKRSVQSASGSNKIKITFFTKGSTLNDNVIADFFL